MVSHPSLGQPSFGKLIVSFGLGVGIGVLALLPGFADGFAGAIQGDPGPVGNALLVGILLLVVVTLGLFSLFQLLWLVDR